jgi:hypothetical protein
MDRSLLLFGHLLLLFFLVAILSSCTKNQQNLPTQHYRLINNLSFYQDTEFGEVAVIEGAETIDEAKKSEHLVPLKPYTIFNESFPNGAYFKFNHRSQISTTQASHLGVLLIKVVQSGKTHPIDVYRDGGWVREGMTNQLSEFNSSHDVNWSQFVDNLTKWVGDTNEIYSDDFLKGPWHAIPDHNSIASWEYRSFWPKAIDNCTKSWDKVTDDALNPNLLCVTAELLKFTPTTNPRTTKPVVWTTNIRDCSYIFLALYAPSQGNGMSEVEEWYWIHIKQN